MRIFFLPATNLRSEDISVSESGVFLSPQLEQLYSLSLCSKEDCNKILTLHQWNLQQASRYLMRWSREDRAAASDRERQQISAERRV